MKASALTRRIKRERMLASQLVYEAVIDSWRKYYLNTRDHGLEAFNKLVLPAHTISGLIDDEYKHAEGLLSDKQLRAIRKIRKESFEAITKQLK